MITVSNLYFSYNGSDRRVLNGISVHIKKGELFSIIGVNGSGKSTLAKHFNAILLPTEGSVVVDGIDTKERTRTWEIRSKVGMVFQNPDNQIVSSVVEEEVAFGPENIGLSSGEIRRRVDEALKVVGLYDMKERPTYALSGGEKQRLAIASVLAMQPECIVFDEPTAMLDPAGRREVASVIERLRGSIGITVIYITHIIDEVVFSDRVAVMDGGKFSMVGTPLEVFSQKERIIDAGLDIPSVPKLAYILGEMGVRLRRLPLTVEELVAEICP